MCMCIIYLLFYYVSSHFVNVLCYLCVDQAACNIDVDDDDDDG